MLIKADILLSFFERETGNFLSSHRNFLRTPPRPTGARNGLVERQKEEEKRERRKFVTPACSRFKVLADTKVSRSYYAILSITLRADVNGGNITLRRRRLRKNERSRKRALSWRTSEVQTRRRLRTLNADIPGTTGIPRIFPSRRESCISTPPF